MLAELAAEDEERHRYRHADLDGGVEAPAAEFGSLERLLRVLLHNTSEHLPQAGHAFFIRARVSTVRASGVEPSNLSSKPFLVVLAATPR